MHHKSVHHTCIKQISVHVLVYIYMQKQNIFTRECTALPPFDCRLGVLDVFDAGLNSRSISQYEMMMAYVMTMVIVPSLNFLLLCLFHLVNLSHSLALEVCIFQP